MKWTDEDKVKALKNTILFKEIPENSLAQLSRDARTVQLENHQVLFSAGESCEGLFVVLEGRTRAFRHGIDGREQVIHEDGPFSTFPEVAVFDNGPYPSSVIATEKSQLMFIPKNRVLQFCLEHPQVAMSALRVISKRLRKATGMVEDLSLKGVSQRLAEFLLNQIRNKTGNIDDLELKHFSHGTAHIIDGLELKHSNQEIGDIIGTVREVVSRAFAKLQRRGWIKKDGKLIRIVDREALNDHVTGGLD